MTSWIDPMETRRYTTQPTAQDTAQRQAQDAQQYQTFSAGNNNMPPTNQQNTNVDPNAGMPPTQDYPYGGNPNQAGGNNPASPWATMPPNQANYDQMQQFGDQAYDYSRRYVDPQQEQDQRRINQEMVNRGVDPQSQQGQEMMDQMSMRHGDQNDASAFGAMQFGQGIQNQMFGQQLGWGGLELGRQQQDFSELMGYDSIDYRNNQYNELNNRWDQKLAMSMAGLNPPDSSGTVTGGQSQYTPWNSWWDSMQKTWGN
jgi:hypothetical protein